MSQTNANKNKQEISVSNEIFLQQKKEVYIVLPFPMFVFSPIPTNANRNTREIIEEQAKKYSQQKKSSI